MVITRYKHLWLSAMALSVSTPSIAQVLLDGWNGSLQPSTSKPRPGDQVERRIKRHRIHRSEMVQTKCLYCSWFTSIYNVFECVFFIESLKAKCIKMLNTAIMLILFTLANIFHNRQSCLGLFRDANTWFMLVDRR